jgi:FtsP/CotA-like multicopper oxidase with cupredoxin domain
MVVTAAVLACTLALSTACGSDAKTPDTQSPVGTKTIQVTVSGDTVTPNGDRVQVAVGQRIDLVVTADAPGEIHVHSSPEQEFEYKAGTQTLTLAPIEKPSIVDVESHTLEKTIVQLEAR